MMMMITKTRRIYLLANPPLVYPPHTVMMVVMMRVMRECFSERAVELQERICIWFEGKLSLGAFSQNIQFAPQPCMKGLLNDFPAKYLNLSDIGLSDITKAEIFEIIGQRRRGG